MLVTRGEQQMLTERIGYAEQNPVADGAQKAKKETARNSLGAGVEPRGNAIRGLGVGAALSLGFWMALAALIWALRR